MDKILYGSGKEKIHFHYENEFGKVRENNIAFEGVIQILNVVIRNKLLILFVSKWRNIWRQQACPTCKGYRLKQESISCISRWHYILVKLRISIEEAHDFFRILKLTEKEMQIAQTDFKRNS